jgi:hypothetical protein
MDILNEVDHAYDCSNFIFTGVAARFAAADYAREESGLKKLSRDCGG